MKKTTLLLLTTFLIAHANAAVITVNITPGSAAQFTEIAPAMAAANPNDTIYVSGSAVTYADATITKSITLIGNGPFTSQQNHYPTYCHNLTLTNNTSNIKIEGFLLWEIRGNSLNNVHYLDITNNYFPYTGNFTYILNSSGMVNCSDFNFHNNTIEQNWPISLSAASGCFNMIIEHNIFHRFDGSQPTLSGFNFPNGVIQNNTFIYYPPNSNPFIGVSNAMIQNNIFYNCDATVGVSASTYNNNITYSSSSTLPLLGGTNIDNTNPQFVNVALSPTVGFAISNNYNVQTSGPAHNTGSDGTDIGYYGGPSIINLTPTGEVYNMPVIRQMNIQNISVPQNGNVNVKVRSTKSKSN